MATEYRNIRWQRAHAEKTHEGATALRFASDDGDIAVTISDFDLIKLHTVLTDMIYLRAMPDWRAEAERRWNADTLAFRQSAEIVPAA